MTPLRQQKAVQPGETRSWALDLEAMVSCAVWAGRDPDLLRGEVAQLLAAFPTLVAAVGVPLSDDRCWVEAAEPLLCGACGELVVFDQGIRCARCAQPATPPAQPTVGLVGRIPALISGRPFERDLLRRLEVLQRTRDGRAAAFARCLISAGGRSYLAPRYALWFSQSWPHSDPPVMVWEEYFDVLNIPPDHVYFADQYYRLCLYASWREQPAVRVLQNRVVPRLLIDLMVADLQAVGRLDEALLRLDASLYELYNTVGRPDQVRSLQQLYDEIIGQAPPAEGALEGPEAR